VYADGLTKGLFANCGRWFRSMGSADTNRIAYAL